MAASCVGRAARWLERLAFTAGIICLLAASGIWWQAARYQRDAKKQLEELIGTVASPVTVDTNILDRRADSLVGRLDIPRLQLSVAVLEGDDDLTLRLAAGHLPATPLPWEDGNAALAGHRDTFFRPLKDVRLGDDVQLTTRHGRFQYRVRRLAVVGPDAVEVLSPSEHAGLTLITCYPFRYVGSAPQRFIVQAERVSDGE